MNEEMSKIFSLKGKNIWVLGGAGYLGKYTVMLLHEMGAKLLCVDLENRAELFKGSIRFSYHIETTPLDVRDGAAIKPFVAKKIKRFGIPDGLVNLTFAFTASKLEDISEKEFDQVNHGGLTSAFLLSGEVGS